ncbi:oxidoreductase domain containing [Cordyceps militaris]|uniref:Putative gamma-glutamylcyclotransferase n=1 Tax=Cordyceps militaris TaxID=73501 RepID=A0A2H4SK93_CORMI|nr:oxidoreductase domain containing [Cordyceps militaris]
MLQSLFKRYDAIKLAVIYKQVSTILHSLFDMDLLSACESLASNVLEYNAIDTSDLQISDSDVEHWRVLFQLTRAEAIEEITNWRLDLGRESLSQSAWETIKESKAASGFNKESYAYSLARGWRLKPQNITSTAADNSMYLLRIQETLPSIRTVQDLLNTDKLNIVSGLDDDGKSVQFCYMTAQMKSLLLCNLALSNSLQFRPTFIQVSIATKNLSDNSRYPTLGIDSTLPQHRPQSSTECFQPAQNEYPVPYFFYGTLADRTVLARVLGLSDENSITYKPAEVSGATMTMWANKYRGLVDSDQDDTVEGVVYLVRSHEEEEALRIYATAKYEVVRCLIRLSSEPKSRMAGLTFRLT